MTLDSELTDLPIPRELAHDWWGLATWIVIAVAVVLAIRAVYQIRAQVKNSHTNNLRDDLDEKFASLEAKMGSALALLGDHGTRLNSIEESLRQT